MKIINEHDPSGFMKLSIITINYNNKEGLQKTIDSVVNQTWRNFEWIIIDGGSTDGSKELIEQYQQHFAYWCSEPDKGVYNAMNKGIDHAQGEYLLFLNSGDALHNSNTLEEIGLSQFCADIISGEAVSQGTGKPMKIYHPDIVCQLFFDSLNHQATFIKRALFDKYQYNEDNRIVSDWEFFIRAILIDGCSYSYSEVVVADFDPYGISNQEDMFSLQQSERKRVLEKYFSSYIRQDLQQYFNILDSYGYKKVREIKQRYSYIYRILIKLISWFHI